MGHFYQIDIVYDLFIERKLSFELNVPLIMHICVSMLYILVERVPKLSLVENYPSKFRNKRFNFILQKMQVIKFFLL